MDLPDFCRRGVLDKWPLGESLNFYGESVWSWCAPPSGVELASTIYGE